MFWLSSSFPVLIIARILQGFSGTAIWTLGLALICDVVPAERIGAIMGYVMIGWSIGTAGGPLVGGVLYDFLGYNSIFIFVLVLLVIDFILRSLIQDKKCIQVCPVTAEGDAELNDKETISIPASESSDAPKPPSAARALLSLLTNPTLWTLCVITFVLGFAFGGLLDTGMTMLVKERYGLSARGAALIFIAAIVPSFVSSPLAGHFADKYGAKWPIVVCLAIGTPFYGLMSINGSLAALIVWVTLLGFFIASIAAPIMQDLAEIVKCTPGLGFAHVYGIFNVVYSLGTMVGPLFVGGLFEHTGNEKGWQIMSLVLSGMCALCILPAWLFLGGKKTTIAQSSIPASDSKLDSPV